MADTNSEKTIHTLKSSNLPFYSAIWEAAKSSRALVTFHKRFYWGQRPSRESKRAFEKRCALVDIFTSNGEEWIKVSTISQQRLLFELAKARWEAADSSNEEDEDDDNQVLHCQIEDQDSLDEDELSRVELVRTANDLQRAAQSHRIHYQRPRIRIVLPKISDPPSSELEPLLKRLRLTGATLDYGAPPAPDITVEDLQKEIFPRLLPSPHPPLTDTLNIDCTILLALVSDLSYTANHPILPGYNTAIKRQIELESHEHLLPSSLWPALGGRHLVCTVEAANRMREIVNAIGMPKERARTDLIMGNDQPDASQEINGLPASAKHSSEQLRNSLQEHSDYQVPPDFNIPVRIVSSPTASDISGAIESEALPAVAEQIAAELTEINRSVFLYGWLHGLTTVSSNRAVAKAIESIIEKHDQGEKGPEIWLREPARSLLGKEKERRK